MLQQLRTMPMDGLKLQGWTMAEVKEGVDIAAVDNGRGYRRSKHCTSVQSTQLATRDITNIRWAVRLSWFENASIHAHFWDGRF